MAGLCCEVEGCHAAYGVLRLVGEVDAAVDVFAVGDCAAQGLDVTWEARAVCIKDGQQ